MNPSDEFYLSEYGPLCVEHKKCKWAAPEPCRFPLTVAFLVQHEMREMFLDRAKSLQLRLNAVRGALG